MLGTIEDEEVIAPKLNNLSSGKEKHSSIPNSMWVILGVAASLSLIMVVGYLTQFQISYSNQGLRAGFGNKIDQPLELLTSNDVEQLIEAQLSQERQAWSENVQRIETNFKEQLEQNQAVQLTQMSRLAKANKVMPNEDIVAFVDQLKMENRAQLETFFDASAQEQEKYMKEVLNEFFKYLGEQRKEDMKFIQANLLEINSVTDERQQETDKILSSIITTVYTQNSIGR